VKVGSKQPPCDLVDREQARMELSLKPSLDRVEPLAVCVVDELLNRVESQLVAGERLLGFRDLADATTREECYKN
jgi:hypothetical protein